MFGRIFFPPVGAELIEFSPPFFRKLQVPNIQVLTSGSGTYNTPAGALYLTVTMAGGGGGGGGAASGGLVALNGAGGGGGGSLYSLITSPAASYSYAVGAGGGAGTAGTNGQAGGAGAAGVIIVTAYFQ